MTNQEVVDVWIKTTDVAIDALQRWRDKLKEWRQFGCCDISFGEFNEALCSLRLADLGEWADYNEASLFRLTQAVTSQSSK